MLSLESASASLAKPEKQRLKSPRSVPQLKRIPVGAHSLSPCLERLCEAVLDAELNPRVIARASLLSSRSPHISSTPIIRFSPG